MAFPITKFSKLSLDQFADVRTPEKERYNRSRALGSKREFWIIGVTNPPVPYSEGMAIGAKLASYRGAYSVTTLPNPFPEIVTRAGLQLNVAASDKDTSIEIKNLPLNNTQACAAGDFIRIIGHAKVYQVIDDASSDGAGVATVNITPPLFEDVAIDTAIDYGSNVNFQVCLEDFSTLEVNASNGKNITYTFDLMEQG